MSLPVAVLAGGLATRLRPITEKIPKSLVEVAGKPFIDHQLELLKRNGHTKVVLCVEYLGEMIEAVVGDGHARGMEVSFSHDGGKLLGTAGALRRALPLLGEAFLVMYGDSYLECDFTEVETAFVDGGRKGLMTVYRNEDRYDRSNVLFADGRIIKYEKRQRTPDMRHIDYGLGALRASALAHLSEGAPADLADVYRDLAISGQLAGYEVTGRFYEIGSVEGLADTRNYLGTKERAR